MVKSRVITHFLEKGFTCLCLPSGVRTIAPNGFMNGTGEEEGITDDSYPDGPLQSGTSSLRRVKTKSKVGTSRHANCKNKFEHVHVSVLFKVKVETSTSL